MVGDAVAVVALDLDDALFDRPPGTHEPSQFLSDARQIGRRNTGHEGDGLALPDEARGDGLRAVFGPLRWRTPSRMCRRPIA